MAYGELCGVLKEKRGEFERVEAGNIKVEGQRKRMKAYFLLYSPWPTLFWRSIKMVSPPPFPPGMPGTS